MKKRSQSEHAVFIAAVETRAADGAFKKETKAPAIFLLSPQMIELFVTSPSEPPPPELKDAMDDRPFFWSEKYQQICFQGVYWSCQERTWQSMWFRSTSEAKPFLDGSVSLRLTGICAEPGPERSVQTIALSRSALSKLGQTAASKRKYVLAAEKGVKMFSDFEAFEHIYLHVVEEMQGAPICFDEGMFVGNGYAAGRVKGIGRVPVRQSYGGC